MAEQEQPPVRPTGTYHPPVRLVRESQLTTGGGGGGYLVGLGDVRVDVGVLHRLTRELLAEEARVRDVALQHHCNQPTNQDYAWAFE